MTVHSKDFWDFARDFFQIQRRRFRAKGSWQHAALPRNFSECVIKSAETKTAIILRINGKRYRLTTEEVEE